MTDDHLKETGLRFGRALTPDSFERVLLGASPTTKSAHGWSERAKQRGLFIDLSKVEFAEFVSLAQVALLVEGAVRNGISVRVALPLKKMRSSEQGFVDQCSASGDPQRERLAKRVEERVEKRRQAADFMLHSGFEDVIQVRHVDRAESLVQIQKDYDSSEEDREEPAGDGELEGKSTPSWEDQQEFPDDTQHYYKLQCIFPMQWIRPLARREFERSGKIFAFVANAQTAGLTEPDAMAMASTVLGELVENVHQHAREVNPEISCEPHALVGVISLDPARYRIRPTNFRPCMSDFVGRCQQATSPIIRVAIGDSGRGIPQVLGPHFKPENQDEIPKFADTERPLSQAEEVLFWSFNKWSTSKEEGALAKRGTRGLWLVQSLVQGYGGSVTIRAEDAMVGWQHSTSGEAKPCRDHGIRFVPGTFVDVCFFPGEDIALKGVTPGEEPLTVPAPELGAVRCVGLGERLVADEDLERIVRELARAVPTKPGCVLVILQGGASSSSSRAVQQAIIETFGLPNHGGLALLFIGVAPEIVRNAAGLKDAGEQDFQRLGIRPSEGPLLLMDVRGKATWFSSDPALCRVLDHCSAEPHHQLSADAVVNLASRDVGAAGLYRQLRRLPDFVHLRNDGSISLHITARYLNRFLVENASRQLQVAIAEGRPPYVIAGLFLTPSLEHVNRWIHVAELLENTFGIGPSMYALARKIDNVLEQPSVHLGTPKMALFRVAGTSAEVAGALAQCLGAQNPRYVVPGGLTAYGHSEAAVVRPGERIVLCADLILTGNTVRGAIGELARQGAKPVVVACVVDARRVKTDKIRDVPIVSLVDVEIAVPEPGPTIPVTPIDPVLLEPAATQPSGGALAAQYPIPPETLLRWCEEGQDNYALCFGHIVREVGRHFPTYLDSNQLIGEEAPRRDEIIGAFAEQVKAWVRARNGDRLQSGKQSAHAIEIWHPGGPNDFAGKMATATTAMLRRHSDSVSKVLVRGIPRAACMGRWVFPGAIEPVAEPSHVVMVDWGSITSATIQQLLRLAGQSGAESFLALVFLSQMPAEEEMALRRVSSIISAKRSRKEPDDKGRRTTRMPLFDEWDIKEESVPAQVIFLSSLRLRHYSPRECPICRLAEAYGSEEEHCPSRLLQQHAQKTAERLERHERQELFARAQQDLYGAALSARDIGNVVRLRQQLEDAVRSTEQRQRVLGQLAGAGASGDRSCKMGWIRLLATEPIWLKLPPLCFEQLRETVAGIAYDVASEGKEDGSDTPERQQAIITLRAASKDKFAEKLPELLEACCGDKVLVGQLLYDTYTYLKKSYHESRESLTRWRNALVACRDRLEQMRAAKAGVLEYAVTVGDLLRATEFLMARGGAPPDQPRQAWKMLRDHYMRTLLVSMHTYADRALDVAILLGEPPTTEEELPDRARWERTYLSWEACLGFLSANLFPYLHPLREILAHEVFSRQMGTDRDRLLAVIDEGIPFGVGRRLTEMLWGFIREPASFREARKREEANREWRWWYGLFLQTGGGGDRPPSRATFLRILEDCPCNLGEAILDAVEGAKQKRYPFQVNTLDEGAFNRLVFCDKSILVNTISHALRNAAAPKHRSGEDDASIPVNVMFDCDWRSTSGRCVLRIWNDGTTPTSPPGLGLRALDADLSAYGATVRGEEAADDRWSYVTVIDCAEWS